MSENRQRRWSSRSVGARWQHQFFYLLIRLGGRWSAYLFARLVVGWYMLLRPDLRERCRPYLARRFPGEGANFRQSFKLSYALAQAIIDRAMVGILDPGRLKVEFRGREKLTPLMEARQGFILMGAHVGCWQAAMSAIGFLGMPVNMLITREAGDVDRHWFEHRKGDMPFKIIDPSGYLGGTLDMIAALKNGEVVCVMGDRTFGSEGSALALPFLGEPAQFPVSAYKLASATGAPVVVMLSHKSGPDSYVLEIARIINVPERLPRGRAGVAPYARQFVQALEAFVGEHPYQFFNFFDMWAGGPAERTDAAEPTARAYAQGEKP
ncbi:putative acyltransferase [Desulfocurvibacter africanus PCS]|uniref:Putative acyltransferase n=1 Tax=Desulfocurvibacter africanus PCS TaxID=1262666 RepID=M5PVE6_DESAF|nr:lysophospholipid acyltransferase family protein [Desulfocurvibacter africanus]EMG38317.1 putative acyltransferase [Desulfocurvibacter africanus PCS]